MEGKTNPAARAPIIAHIFMGAGFNLIFLLPSQEGINAASMIRSSSNASSGVRLIHEPKHPQSSVTPVIHAQELTP